MAPANPTGTTDGIFRRIAEATASVTGSDYLQALLAPMCDVLQVRYAFIAEFIDAASTARVLAWWDGESYAADHEYPLAGTPCECVLDGAIHCFADGVAEQFPDEHDLVELGIRSYMAVPLIDAVGAVLGHLAIMDTRPLTGSPRDQDVFRIFGAMAGAALQRKRIEDALRASERSLARVIDSAPDAIVTLDAALRVTSFNPAAARIFGVADHAVRGDAFECFLTPGLRDALRAQMREPAQAVHWSPPGLEALRADGARFAVEYTLSALEPATDGRCVLMLRDTSERDRQAAELSRLQSTQRFLLHEARAANSPDGVIGRSAAMQSLWQAIAAVAGADSTVLIQGETGTGKERIAHEIHQQSRRADAMLVKMNCAALPADLIESELFGHEKGAFTGATAQRKGRFELADGGTLFLDEVGELTLAAQAKLLRVLQEQEFERVGGSGPIRVDVRVIAATNRDLDAMVRRGEFRADLYYRIQVFPLRVPPLRERRDDIEALARYFLTQNARKLGRPLRDFDRASWAFLQRYDWPGNVRELQNIVERAAVLATDDVAIVRDLGGTDRAVDAGDSDTGLALTAVEAAHLRHVLEKTGWIIEGPQGAAALLALEPSTLRSRLRKLGISRPARPPRPA